jgi:3-hydroxymyristoyl/3-hydroxydecanoyl-(acyl carrier protein) dehydratase
LPESTLGHLQAQLAVPEQAAFFEDHFPRRPVFPATLLLDALLQLAVRVVGQAANGKTLRLTRITNVKVRAFTAPGASLALSALLATPGSDDLEPYMVKLSAQAEGKTIAGAKMYFALAGDTA